MNCDTIVTFTDGDDGELIIADNSIEIINFDTNDSGMIDQGCSILSRAFQFLAYYK